MRWLIRLGILAVLALLIWFVWPFLKSGKAQAETCHRDLFRAAERRQWDKAAVFLASTYEDQWGNRAPEAINVARELLMGFIVLDIDWTTIELSENDGTVKVRGHAKITGSGAGFSQAVMDETNKVKEPWVFTWRKENWKPSSWKLINVKNPALEGQIPSL